LRPPAGRSFHFDDELLGGDGAQEGGGIVVGPAAQLQVFAPGISLSGGSS
jgi:hypothetical protein